MESIRTRLIRRFDQALGVLFPAVIFGTAMAFGGMVWWGRPFVVALTLLVSLAWFLRCGVAGRWPVLFSPLGLLGVLAVGIGVAQLMPWPGALASMVSPNARSVHSLGSLPGLMQADDPSAEIPAPFTARSPLTLDRGATLRWVVGALACLALFWTASHFTNRLGRLSLIWGSVVAAFVLNGAIVVVQLVGFSDGLFGFITPGSGPRWAPSSADVLDAPGQTVMRPVTTASDVPRSWVFARPVATENLGTMPGGASAFLALGSLGLPMALAMTLQLMACRGSREPFWARLRQTGNGSLLILLYAATILTAGLVGVLSGKLAAAPFLAGILLVGLPSLFGTGLRFKAFLLTTLTCGALVGGVALGDAWKGIFGEEVRLPRVDLTSARESWAATLPILKSFPMVGVGLGAYGSVSPYFKASDATSTTAQSSLAQWASESGLAGLVILGLALFWGLVRLPVAVARVGSADRALAFGFVGTAVCFLAYATLRWSVELTAVAVAASVFAGTMNRWLAGGTDLLVEASDA